MDLSMGLAVEFSHLALILCIYMYFICFEKKTNSKIKLLQSLIRSQTTIPIQTQLGVLLLAASVTGFHR